MKKHEFTRTVFRDGVPVFEKGQRYDVTDATRREVARGHAIEVTVAVETATSAEAKKSKGKK